MTTYTNGNQLFVDAYHPNNTTIKQEKYCIEIINAVGDWQNTRLV